jgi:hypothetical protein
MDWETASCVNRFALIPQHWDKGLGGEGHGAVMLLLASSLLAIANFYGPYDDGQRHLYVLIAKMDSVGSRNYSP